MFIRVRIQIETARILWILFKIELITFLALRIPVPVHVALDPEAQEQRHQLKGTL